MARMIRGAWACLLLGLSTVCAAAAEGDGLVLRADGNVGLGVSRLSDSTKTPTPRGATNTVAGPLVWGISGRGAPYRGVLLDIDYFRAGTNLDTPDVVPTATDVSWSRLRLAAGWRFDLDYGPLRAVNATLGWGRERWSSSRQSPTQETPSWTHNELELAGEVAARLLDEKVEVRVRLALAPFMDVNEDFDTNGSVKSALGFDAGVAGTYAVMTAGPGDLLAGGEIGWGGRWIGHQGVGTRRSIAAPGLPPTAVRDVNEFFNRTSFLATIAYRFPAAGGGMAGGVAGASSSGGEQEAPEQAVVTTSEIKLKGRVQFAANSATLDMSASRDALETVARALKDHAGIKVDVCGHTDDRGESKVKKELSLKRAEAVVRALTDMGIDGARLRARGFGDGQPLVANDTEEGRARNRRVEFRIVVRIGE
jgi:outer membrane protein OmpA-like peptidoglycan-associated protein